MYAKGCAVLCVLLICAVCLGSMCGCAQKTQTYSVFGLGSLLQVVDFAADADLHTFCEQIVADVQAAVDLTQEGSDLARFNAAVDEERIAVSALTYDLVAKARQAYDVSGGLYDPTAYWSVDLWGFLPRGEQVSAPYDRSRLSDGAYPLPDEQYIAAFAALADMRKIEAIYDQTAGIYYLCKHATAVTLQGVTYYARLDLGGIAKGYVVDSIRQYAKAHGIDKGYVNFGSSSMLLLRNRKGSDWDLSLTHPRKEGATYCTLPAKDVTVATSGDYQNYYMVNGVRYSHLIDPRTGRPMQSDLLSVTVLTSDACLGDALATALTVGGLERLKAFVQSDYARDNGVDVIAVYADGTDLAVFSTVEVDKHL